MLAMHGVSNECWKQDACIIDASLQVCTIVSYTMEFKLHITITLDKEQIAIPLEKDEFPLLV